MGRRPAQDWKAATAPHPRACTLTRKGPCEAVAAGCCEELEVPRPRVHKTACSLSRHTRSASAVPLGTAKGAGAREGSGLLRWQLVVTALQGSIQDLG